MIRKFLHFLAGFVLWLVFVYYWSIVASRPLNPYSRFAVIVIAIIILIAMVAMIWWVFHNLSIYRKLQRRKTRWISEGRHDKDYLGRFVVFDDPKAVKTSSYIEIEVKGKEKVFRTSKPIA